MIMGHNQSTMTINAGQDSSFAGAKSTGTANAADDNGFGNFYYTPPSGFLAMCTGNLPIDENIDPAEGSFPKEHCDHGVYSGTGTAQNITGLNFKPDCVWISQRSTNTTSYNYQFDSTSGVNKYVQLQTAITLTDDDFISQIALESKRSRKDLFNTVKDKKITFLGWAFKKNTNDTRESAAIYVANHLIEDGADIFVYDPKVSEKRIKDDLRDLWKSNNYNVNEISNMLNKIIVCKNYEKAIEKSHAVAILTEWDEFIDYNWKSPYASMEKPAFIYDGRNILDKSKLTEIGFKVFQIGK